VATVPTVGASVGSSLVTLCTAQTGTGPSTNVADRGPGYGPALLTITSTIGATPTVTVDIQGSADGTNWFNIAYALAATPETPVVTSLTITTAVTSQYILRHNQPWRFCRLNLSSNTNVTLTSTLYVP
jgi:hypothetical protein